MDKTKMNAEEQALLAAVKEHLLAAITESVRQDQCEQRDALLMQLGCCTWWAHAATPLPLYIVDQLRDLLAIAKKEGSG